MTCDIFYFSKYFIFIFLKKSVNSYSILMVCHIYIMLNR